MFLGHKRELTFAFLLPFPSYRFVLLFPPFLFALLWFTPAPMECSAAHWMRKSHVFLFFSKSRRERNSAPKNRESYSGVLFRHETMCLVSRTWPCQLDVKVESTANLFSEKIFSADDHPTDTRLIQHSAGTASNGTPVSCYLKWQIEQATWDSFRSSSTLSKVIE